MREEGGVDDVSADVSEAGGGAGHDEKLFDAGERVGREEGGEAFGGDFGSGARWDLREATGGRVGEVVFGGRTKWWEGVRGMSL